jgi:peroxiredoxin
MYTHLVAEPIRKISSLVSGNQLAPSIHTFTISDQEIDLSQFLGRKVLIKFHRFSGCPIAQDQIHEVIRRQNELTDAGIETVVLLHSSKKKILANFNEVPGLHIIADRQKKFYRLYQAAFSWGKLFSPDTWRATFRSIFRGYFPQFTRFEGGIIGVPADFLLDRKGKVVSWHYGKHFGDSWSVSQVLKEAAMIH